MVSRVSEGRGDAIRRQEQLDRTVNMLSEQQCIDILRRKLLTSDEANNRELITGIGDDAAVIHYSQTMVLSVDTVSEGTHFTRQLIDLQTLARKAMRTAVSDLHAMGAVAKSCLCAWSLPQDIRLEEFESLVDGSADEANEQKMTVIGGNLCRASNITLTTTVIGTASERGVVHRCGAKVGDSIWVCGRLGWAAVGLLLLQRSKENTLSAANQRFVQYWRLPPNHAAFGKQLPEFAHAAIDVSDGLSTDLLRICKASTVGAELWIDRLANDPDFEAACHQLKIDPLQTMLDGGEDYALLFTAPAHLTPPAPALQIGVITAPEAGVQVLRNNQKSVLLAQGYEHFSP